jgi:3-deoxy-D-manno-octulosonic-acid transferase
LHDVEHLVCWRFGVVAQLTDHTQEKPADKPTAKSSCLLKTWMLATAIMPGLLGLLARRAHAAQSGDAARLGERFGKPTATRPNGPLVWMHAASVGEAVSIIPLARAIRDQAGATLLFTTSTVGGAKTVAKRLPDAVHQFLPIDTPAAVDGFLSFWQPDTAIFTEGDLWPRLLSELSTRGTPTALVNARASKSRARLPRVYGTLLSKMQVITAQDDTIASGLVDLGLDPQLVQSPGNLKAEIDLPPTNPDLQAAFTKASQGRASWAAVSTHKGEDEVILNAHVSLPDNPLLLLVPRHPERGDALVDLLVDRDIAHTRQSLGELPTTDTCVHLVDVFGETGAVYASTGLAFVGGSLLPGPGGHTPFEPAAMGCAILSGQHVQNFSSAYKALQTTGGAQDVQMSEDLQPVVQDLLSDHDTLTAMQKAAQTEYQRQTGAIDRTLALLSDILPG